MEAVQNGQFENSHITDHDVSPKSLLIEDKVLPELNGHNENGVGENQTNGHKDTETTNGNIENGEKEEECNQNLEKVETGAAKEVEKVVETEENGVESEEEEEEGEEEEDLPLIQLCSKNTVNIPDEVQVESPTPEKEPEETFKPCFPQIRGRPGLRSGSPHLNSSFTVRSEPSSPAGVHFPRLRKAEGQLSLLSTTPGRKRVRATEATPEGPATKRASQSWLRFNLPRWWGGSSEEEAAPSPNSATEALAEPSTSATTRNCIVM